MNRVKIIAAQSLILLKHLTFFISIKQPMKVGAKKYQMHSMILNILLTLALLFSVKSIP